MLRGILRYIIKLLLKILNKPNKVSVEILRGDKMSLIYKVNFPPLGAKDVVVRNLEVTVNGEKSIINIVPPSSPSYLLPPLKEGDSVLLRISDIDDRQNASLWSDGVSFVAADTIAPPQPGAVSVDLVSEEDDEPAPPKVNVVTAEAVVAPVAPKTPPASD